MSGETSPIREHRFDIRVRYAETDAMGFLHHANFLVFFEMGRTELFRAQGGNYREMEEKGLFLVVVRVNVSYKAPARYDDLLTLTTRIAKVTPAKLVHEYELRRGDTVIATAETTLACINREGRIQLMLDVMPGLKK
jgi:acyl-CoA thioester hydrolase